MSENVYVVAPKSNDISRVQRTSQASAVSPDRAMATNTSRRPEASATSAASRSAPAASSVCGVNGARPAMSRAVPATATFSATAT